MPETMRISFLKEHLNFLKSLNETKFNKNLLTSDYSEFLFNYCLQTSLIIWSQQDSFVLDNFFADIVVVSVAVPGTSIDVALVVFCSFQLMVAKRS